MEKNNVLTENEIEQISGGRKEPTKKKTRDMFETCPQCGNTEKLYKSVCPICGYYAGQKIIEKDLDQ